MASRRPTDSPRGPAGTPAAGPPSSGTPRATPSSPETPRAAIPRVTKPRAAASVPLSVSAAGTQAGTAPLPTAEKTPTVEKPPVARRSRAKKPEGSAASAPVQISEDVRRGMIAEAAYLRAERRGFRGGDEREDWIAAEAEVDALLRAGHGTSRQ
jgi:hypothetical protein